MATNPSKHQKIWIIASMLIFIGIELVLGGVIGRLILGRFISQALALRFEMILMLASYFLGGLLVGLLSPDIRVLEPAIGAALAVAVTFAYYFFIPSRIYVFSINRLLVGGAIAFILALIGADLGERIAARLGNSASKYYSRQ